MIRSSRGGAASETARNAGYGNGNGNGNWNGNVNENGNGNEKGGGNGKTGVRKGFSKSGRGISTGVGEARREEIRQFLTARFERARDTGQKVKQGRDCFC